MPRTFRRSRTLANALVLAALGLSAAGCAKKLDAPIALIATDAASAATGATIKLDASQSTDPNGLALSYAWRLSAVPAGSKAAIGAADKMRAWVVLDVPGDYEVELVVSDGELTSEPVRAVVTATACGAAVPTVSALVSTPAAAALGAPVQVSATAGDADLASTCTAGDALAWHWSIAGEPSGSAARLNDGALEAPSFTPDVPGDYVVAVYVTDRAGHASAPASTTVHVDTCGSATPTASAPVASPAAPAVGQVVSLASTLADADETAPCSKHENLTPHWSLASVPSGSHAALNGATLASPSFVPDVPGDYVVDVYATDAEGHVGQRQSLTIAASACGSNAPVVSGAAASPASPHVGEIVSLSATSTDADVACGVAESTAWSWVMVGAPAGSRAALNDGALASPSLTPDVAGAYAFEVTTRDAQGHVSAASHVDVTVSSCGTAAPTATVSADAPGVGGVVALSATVADDDAACGIQETFSYAWSIASLPAGSRAALNDAGATNPSFVADLAGTYTVALVVTDGGGTKSNVVTKDVVVASTPACGASTPVARVGSTQTGVCTNNNYGGGTFTTCTATLGGTPPAYTIAARPSNCTGNCNNNQNTEYLDLQLDAAASFDPDNAAPCSAGQPLSYAWDIVAAPAGGQATFGTAGGNNTATTLIWHSTLVNPTLSFVRFSQNAGQISAPVAGAYKVSLTVSDGVHTSTPVYVTVNVTVP